MICYTPREDLLERQANTDSRGVATGPVRSVGSRVIDVSPSSKYYRSAIAAICSVVLTLDEISYVRHITKCNHKNKYHARDIYTDDTLDLCLQCGGTYSGILHVKLPFQDVVLCNEQL